MIPGAQVTAGGSTVSASSHFSAVRLRRARLGSGRHHVVLLTYSYWQHHFASDPGIVGRTLVGEDGLTRSIGVLPANVLRYRNDFLKPLVESAYSHDRGYHDLDVFGRLKPGVTLAQARARLDAHRQHDCRREYPATNKNLWFNVAPLDKSYAMTNPQANRALVLMLAAVGLRAADCCANVANLLLARTVTRSRECVIRAALGARRARLVRQMLVESGRCFCWAAWPASCWRD